MLPGVLSLFSRNLRKHSAKIIFLTWKGPKKVPQFEGQLSTHEFLLQFSPFISPPFLGGKKGFLPCSCSRVAPKHRGHAVFLLLGVETRGALRLLREIGAKCGGHLGFKSYVVLFFPLWAVCVFSSRIFFVFFGAGPDRWKNNLQKPEQREERSSIRKKKNQKKKKKKSFSSRCCPLFFFVLCLFLFPGRTRRKKRRRRRRIIFLEEGEEQEGKKRKEEEEEEEEEEEARKEKN